jgi:hypothetical protein
MKKLCVALAALGVVACVVGCGGGGGDYSSPKATFNTMWEAAKAGNKDAMMACFSTACRKKMDEFEKLFADFPKEMKEGKEDVAGEMMAKAKKAKAEVGAEKIDGDKATLEVTTNGRKGAFQFVKENGAWKIQLPITDAQLGMIKAGLELMKKTPQAVKDGLKALSGKIKKDLERDQ